MNILEIIILGIIQGITEFLPISSSGHLVIAQNILGIKSPGNTLEVLFHFGTLMSVVYVFFEDLKQILLTCLLYTSPSPRDVEESRMPSSA